MKEIVDMTKGTKTARSPIERLVREIAVGPPLADRLVRNIPRAVEDSARKDGATDGTTFIDVRLGFDA